MASDSISRRTGLRGWLLAGAIAGAFVIPFSGIVGTAPLSAGHVASPRPAATAVQDRLVGYGQPHPTFVLTPTPAALATQPPTPIAAPVPAAQRASAPAPRPVAAHAAPPRRAPAPVSYRNRLLSADGALNTGVGYYSDCSGRTALSHAYAAIDTCVGGRTYFVGHNPGVFSPLFREGVGSIITWFDGGGNAHRLRIIGVRTWYRSSGVPPLMGGATVQFQTCITSDGSVDRIMDAAPA